MAWNNCALVFVERFDYKGRACILAYSEGRPSAEIRQNLRNDGFHWNEFDGFWWRFKQGNETLDGVRNKIIQAH